MMVIKSSLKILQCNLGRCKKWQHEFVQYFIHNEYSIALISEPATESNKLVKNIPGIDIYQFSLDQRVKACIFVNSNHKISSFGITQLSTPNISTVKIKFGNQNVSISSVYVEPNEDSNNTMERIDFLLKETTGQFRIIGGDFNGWHPIWGSATPNARGRDVLELVYANDLHICNSGDTPTFQAFIQGQQRSSVIDLTFVSSCHEDQLTGWAVNLDASPLSQHNAIEYKLESRNQTRQNNLIKDTTFKYKSKKANWTDFHSILTTAISESDILQHDIHLASKEQISSIIDQIYIAIHKACSESMPIRGNGCKHKPPWWSDKLDELKQEAVRIHRELSRKAKAGEPLEELIEARKSAKEIYAQEIQNTSSKNFKDFCQRQGKEDVWAVTNRLLK